VPQVQRVSCAQEWYLMPNSDRYHSQTNFMQKSSPNSSKILKLLHWYNLSSDWSSKQKRAASYLKSENSKYKITYLHI
jgi:hypothetical protein